MAYEFYMDGVLLPIAPAKLQTKIGNANKTYTLIDGGEINVLKSPKLTEISFDVLIPSVHYGYASYENGIFKPVSYFLEVFETLKTSKESFQFIVNRTFPNGVMYFDTNMTVSLEDYTIKEDEKEGFDIIVSVSLKQYKDYGTKKYKIKKKKVKKKKKRKSKKSKVTKHTVKKGESLWSIARKYYDDGTKYTQIYKANKKKIKNPNLIYPGQVLKIP